MKRKVLSHLVTYFSSLLNGFLPAIIWFLIVFVLLFTPGRDLPKMDDWTEKIKLDKLVHMAIFGIMAFLFMIPVSRKKLSLDSKTNYLIIICILVCIWGLLSEFIQRYWIVGRSFDMLDFAADSIGGIVAFFFTKKHLKV
jgi:hypothetical protein